MKRSRKPRMCSFCSKPQDQVQRLIAGPNVFVCDECVVRILTRPEAPQEERGRCCSFCGKKQRQEVSLAVGSQGVCICTACLALCQEILAHGPPLQR